MIQRRELKVNELTDEPLTTLPATLSPRAIVTSAAW
jgi:hypothetical protein